MMLFFYLFLVGIFIYDGGEDEDFNQVVDDDKDIFIM